MKDKIYLTVPVACNVTATSTKSLIGIVNRTLFARIRETVLSPSIKSILSLSDFLTSETPPSFVIVRS
jgi:hypothetical protein